MMIPFIIVCCSIKDEEWMCNLEKKKKNLAPEFTSSVLTGTALFISIYLYCISIFKVEVADT